MAIKLPCSRKEQSRCWRKLLLFFLDPHAFHLELHQWIKGVTGSLCYKRLPEEAIGKRCWDQERITIKSFLQHLDCFFLLAWPRYVLYLKVNSHTYPQLPTFVQLNSGRKVGEREYDMNAVMSLLLHPDVTASVTLPILVSALLMLLRFVGIRLAMWFPPWLSFFFFLNVATQNSWIRFNKIRESCHTLFLLTGCDRFCCFGVCFF